MAKSKGDQANRWKRQWYVASKSGGKDHKVSEDHEGKFFCDCWPFRKNRICDHIREARAAGGRLIGEPERHEPPMEMWTVTMVTPDFDADGNIRLLKVPTVPFGPEHLHFVLTVYYDMLFYDVKWSSIRNMYDEREVTEAFVREFIASRGRCVLQEIDGKAYKVVRDDPVRPGDIQAEKEAAYV